MASNIGRRKFLARRRAQQPGKTPRVGYIRAGTRLNDPFRDEVLGRPVVIDGLLS